MNPEPKGWIIHTTEGPVTCVTASILEALNKKKQLPNPPPGYVVLGGHCRAKGRYAWRFSVCRVLPVIRGHEEGKPVLTCLEPQNVSQWALQEFGVYAEIITSVVVACPLKNYSRMVHGRLAVCWGHTGG